MVQILVPVADIAAGSWGTAPLWSKVDDDSTVSPTGDGVTIASDAVGNNVNTSNADLEGPTSGIDDPVVSVDHILRVRWNSTITRDMTGHFELWQGVPDTGSLIAEATVELVDATELETTATLTGTETDNITDYNDLHFRLWGRGTGGGPNRSLVVDLCELEVPDAVSGQTIAVGVLAQTNPLVGVSGIKTADVGALAETDGLVSADPGRAFDVTTLAETDGLVTVVPILTQVIAVGILATGGIRVGPAIAAETFGTGTGTDWTIAQGGDFDWIKTNLRGASVIRITSGEGEAGQLDTSTSIATAHINGQTADDVDIFTSFFSLGADVSTGVAIIVRRSGSDTFYSMGIAKRFSAGIWGLAPTADAIAIVKQVGGTNTVLAETAATITSGTWRIRARIVGTRLKLKVWQGAEPDAWDLEVDDFELTGAQNFGIHFGGKETDQFDFTEFTASSTIGGGPRPIFAQFEPQTIAVTTLAELNSLISAGVSIYRTIGTLAELEALLAISGIKTADIGILSEINALLAISGIKTADIGTLAELEALLAIAVLQPGGQDIAVTTLAEIEALLAIQARKIAAIGVLAELNSLISAGVSIYRHVGVLAELEALLAIQARKIANIGTLGQKDIGRPIGSVRIIQEGVANIHVASETDIVWPVEPTEGNTVLIAYMKNPANTITKPAGTWVERVAPIDVGDDTTREISVETVTVPASSGTTWNWDIIASSDVLGIAAIEIAGENLGGTLLIETIVDTVSPYVGGPLDGDATPVGEYFYVLIGGSKTFGTQIINWTNDDGFTERSNDESEAGTNWALTLFTKTFFDTQPNATLSIDDDGTGAAILIGIPAAVPSIVGVGILAEVEALLAISGIKTADIGTLAELEALLAIQPLKLATIGTLAELEALIPFGVSIYRHVGVLAEFDALIAIAAELGGDQNIPVGVLAQLDILLAISGIKTADIGTLAELEALLAIQGVKVANIGVLAEFDSLIPAGVSIYRTIGTLAELESLVAIRPLKVVTIGTLAELETLLAIAAVKPIITPVGTLTGFDALLTVSGIKLATIGTLSQLDTLLAISGLKTADVGTLAELEALLAIGGLKTAGIGTIGETEVLIGVVLVFGTPVVLVMRVDAIGKRSIVSAIEYDPNQTATVEGDPV